jgi:hypothetical protein
MVRSIIFIILVHFFQPASAQNIKGSWYGRADVMVPGSASNYLTEFVLKQKGNEVEGIFGYYFKDTYQSFFVRGTYNQKTRMVNIRNLPLLFYASPSRTGIECPMHFQGILMVSKVTSTLKGTFYTDSKYKYTCPELRVNMSLDVAEQNQDSTLRSFASGKKFWRPQEEDVVVSGYAKADTTQKNALAATDTSTGASAGNASAKAPVIVNTSNKELEAEFGKRNNIYEKDIIVYDDSILVSFYDNGDIDDDTISVFLNKKPVLVKRGLTSRALNIYIGLDSTISTHELSMFADNLGKYPPNTALMVISDGKKRYELYLSASLKQNASVRLRRPAKR